MSRELNLRAVRARKRQWERFRRRSIDRWYESMAREAALKPKPLPREPLQEPLINWDYPLSVLRRWFHA